jgi:hypothetical protein
MRTLSHHIFHTDQHNLLELEPLLEALYVEGSDALSTQRLRLLLDGSCTEAESARDGYDKDSLLWQVRYCYEGHHRWHVLWRLAHIGCIVARSAVGHDSLEWVRTYACMADGRLRPEWVPLLNWAVQQQNSPEREWADMAEDIQRDLVLPLLGQRR